MKKSLIFWFAAITCAALFLVGCESPTNGDAGAAGAAGAVPFNDGDVTASDLQLAFALSNNVLIGSGAGTVFGEIPAGKTLYIAGEHAVKTAESLDVQGTLNIYEAAALDASYVSGTAGYLATNGGAITGTGTVSLPYLAAGVTDGPTGIVTYGNSPGGITKTAGSYIAVSAAAPGSSALDVDDIEALFTLPGGPAELTVSDITALTADAVPAEKTLTLTGTNDFSVALNLASGGTLIVNGTLTDSTGVAITASGTTSNITINGTLALAAGSTVAGMLTNNGTITSAATAAATQKALLTLAGDGKVVLSGVGAAVVDSATLALTQNVEITSGGTLKAPVVATPFSGGKTITITDNGVLDFGAAVAGLSLSGVTIVNNGTAAGAITTATTSDAALGVIMVAGGKITATGAITELTQALTVPAGVDLTASTATFAGGGFAVTINGEATLAKATFAAATSLTVGQDASLTAGAATLAATTAVSIGNGGVLKIGDNSPLVLTAAEAGAVTSTGTGKIVSETATQTVLTALLTKAGETLNIEQKAAVTLSAATTVKEGTVLTLGTGGSITADNAAAKALTVAGTVVLNGGTLATGTTATDNGSNPAIAITGTGRIVAGGVVIRGAGSLWDATSSQAKAITITNADGFVGAVNGLITLKGETTINAGNGKVILVSRQHYNGGYKHRVK